MKELILILLIIFASLAFGAEIGGPVFEPQNKIQMPYDYEKAVPGVGKVRVELRSGPAVDEITMKLYAACEDKRTGKIGKTVLIDTQYICEYRSEIYEAADHGFIFQYRRYNMTQAGPSKCDAPNTLSRKTCIELENYCGKRPASGTCLPEEQKFLQHMPTDL